MTMRLASVLRHMKGLTHHSRRCLCTTSQSQSNNSVNLLRHLRARIRASGPLSVAEYMKEVLTNPSSGYYMKKDVFGEQGDFITSPEISQMFGELIGIWCLNEWMRCGSPSSLQIVEFGPGRGTLADDALRAISNFPDAIKHTSVHFVEVSPAMAQMQELKLTSNPRQLMNDPTWRMQSDKATTDKSPYKSIVSKHGPTVHWYKDLKQVPEGFSCFIAHEFLDALPIYKFQKTEKGWREVLVDINNDSTDESPALRFVLAPSKTLPTVSFLKHLRPDETREHIEVCPDAGVLVQDMAERISTDGGVALLADYAHNGEKTDTFRGFKKHELHDVLKDPGSADLTADVDFSYLRHLVQDKVQTHGPLPQSHFLVYMGIVVRLRMLLKKARSEKNKKDLISGYDMLVNKNKMGERFKFFAMTQKSSEQYIPAGFKPPV